MALLYHPDKNVGVKNESHEIFLLIVEAYDILSNPDLKAKYDAEQGQRFDPNYDSVVFNHPFAVSRGHAGKRKYAFDEEPVPKFTDQKERDEYTE